MVVHSSTQRTLASTRARAYFSACLVVARDGHECVDVDSDGGVVQRIDHSDPRPSAGKREAGRFLLTYVAAGFVVLQVVDLFREGLGLPDWVFPTALALLATGLPIAAATALIHGRGRKAMDMPVAERPARRRLTLRRALVGVVVVFAGWGVVVGGHASARALGIGAVGTLVAKGVLEAHDRIVFAEFENRTPDSLLAQTVAEALAVDLSQSRLVRVVGRSEIEAALDRMKKPRDTVLAPGLARELALREGFAAVVEGSLAPVGSGFLVSARIVSAADGVVRASLQQRAEREDALLAAVDELGSKLRDRIGESLRVIRSDPPLAQVTTPSLVALRAYTQSKRVDRADGDHEMRVAFLEEALAADSTFAMAWHDLGWALRVENTPRASEAFSNAYRLRERLTERERHLATAAYHNWVTRDLAKAAAANEAVLALDPNDSWVLNDLSILYDRLQNFARAEAMQRRAVAADTANVVLRGGLVRTLANQGKFDEAEAVLADMAQRAPDLPYGYMMESALAVASGDHARAERRLRELARDHRDSPYQRYLSSWFLGILEATLGRLAGARQHFADAEAGANTMGSTNLAFANAAQNAVALELLTGRPENARLLLANALTRYPFDAMPPAARPYLEAAEMHARLGAPAEARRLVEAFNVAAIAEPGDGALDHAQGVIALTDGDLTGSIELLRASASFGCVICALPDLARAYEESSQIDSAVAVYARFVSVPMTDRLWATATLQLGPALERLAELHEARAEYDDAMGYASRLIELWKAADPELQPRVEAARQRLARLAPDRAAQ